MAFSHDGTLLAIASANSGMVLLDLQTEVIIKSYRPPSGEEDAFGLVFKVLFTPDDRRLVIASEQGVSFWDLDTEALTPLFEPNSRGTQFTVTLSPDGRFLATGGERGVVSIWELVDPPLLLHVLAESDALGGTDINPLSRLVSASLKTYAGLMRYRIVRSDYMTPQDTALGERQELILGGLLQRARRQNRVQIVKLAKSLIEWSEKRGADRTILQWDPEDPEED